MLPNIKKTILSLLAAMLLISPARAQRDSIRISLLSCQPGAAIYELYGHTAIRVQDFIQGQDIVFNYGLFDFDTPHFIWRFSLGKTDYLLGAQRMSSFIREYESRGSIVWGQELNLTPAENKRLYALLIENSRPENRVYRYNFLYGNCATMAIDKIEQSINGSVKYPAPADSMTFRSILQAHSAVKPWSMFAVDLVVGAESDRPLTYRQEAFAPLMLRDLVSKAVIQDTAGAQRPLALPAVPVVSPDHSVDFGTCLINPTQAMWLLLLVVLLFTLWGWLKDRQLVLVDIILFGIQGVAGLVIAFLFFLSVHPAVDTNWLIIILNPIPLFLLPVMYSRIRKGRMDWFLPAEFLVCTCFAVCSKLIPQTLEPAMVIFSATLAVRALSSAIFVMTHIGKGGLLHNRRSAMPARCIAIVLLCSLGQTQAAAQNVRQPRLIIGIVLDQFDMNCLEQLKPILRTDGFMKLMEGGYCISNAVLDFDMADRASGTAAIMTGSSPLDNGIVASQWMNRRNYMVQGTVDDSNYMGQGTTDFTSPQKLLASTIADCMKLSTGGQARICSIGIERDATVLAAGHEADVALWMSPSDCRWCSSDYYGGIPAWAGATQTDRKSSVWEPSVPVEAMSNRDILDIRKAFSHTVGWDSPRDFKTSPMANESVIDLAVKAIDAMGLGLDRNPDLLVLSMYAGNFQGEPTAWWSHEQQDIYLRLDAQIANLMSQAGLKAGSDNVAYFLTSTGYAGRLGHDLKSTRIPNGTVSMERITALLNLYLSAKYDCTGLAKCHYRNHIYLDRKMIEDKGLDLSLVAESCIDLLTQASGIRSVVLLRDLMSVLPDSRTQRIRNAQNQDWSGDIILECLPGWSFEDMTNGQSVGRPGAQWSFPIVLYGQRIVQGRDDRRTSASVLAPTLAYLAGCEMPNACSENPLYDIFK